MKCPFCLTPQLLTSQSLLCGSCSHNEVELVRNSVVENDQLNESTRSEIDDIFKIYHLFKQQHINQINQNEFEKNNQNQESKNEHGKIPFASVSSIKVLSLQLLKLEILNQNIKLTNIKRSQKVIANKTNSVKQVCTEKSKELHSKKQQLMLQNETLNTNFDNAINALYSKILEYKFEKTFQIEKQFLQLQLHHFRILKGIVFEKKQSSSSSSSSKNLLLNNKLYKHLNGKEQHQSLFLFNQPILSIQDFLTYNNKLIAINEYLENLIKLQIELFAIFKIGNGLMSLPYLQELKNYLPDKKFHNLVQEKEDLMMNGGVGFEETHSNNNETSHLPSHIAKSKHIGEDNERIVKLGEAIKLPLSSKTINNQLRRASLNTQFNSNIPSQNNMLPSNDKFVSSKASDTLNDKNSSTNTYDASSDNITMPKISEKVVRSNSYDEPNENSKSFKPEIDSKKSFNSDLDLDAKSSSKNRKLIIIPHKILTKPFTKLTTKEYLKFLLIIVKIIVNFKVFFTLTTDTISKSTDKKEVAKNLAHQSSLNKKTSTSTLSNTINQLRYSNSNNGSSSKSYNKKQDKENAEDDMYDLEKILTKVMNLDTYFESRLNILKQSKIKNDTHVSQMAYAQSSHNSESSSSSSAENGSGSISNSTPLVASSYNNLSTATSNISLASNSIINFGSIDKLEQKSQVNESSSSPFKALYTAMFKDSAKPSKKDFSENEDEVYGNVSVTHGDDTLNKPITNPTSRNTSDLQIDQTANPSSDATSAYSVHTTSDIDFKMVMQNVYRLIANGTSRTANKPKTMDNTTTTSNSKLRGNFSTLNSDMNLNLINTMMQSKVQLDDWDVVSSMY